MQTERFPMETIEEPKVDQVNLADLLSLVQLIITAGRCSNRIDAERWLTT
jgi:hypothetical protein